MSRPIITCLATAALLLAGLVATALANPLEPKIGQFSAADYERARQQTWTPEPGVPWEDVEAMQADQDLTGSRIPLPGDDDTAHYGRGSTLILHVFIDHTGGTWSETERDAAGAKAANAKDWYLDEVPAGANLSFDNEGTTAYVYYQTSLPYFIPDSGCDGPLMEDAVAAIGWGDTDGDGSRVDDMTIGLQNWGGGWDNVYACFQPAQTGRAWASYGHAKTALYTDSNWQTWAHEWGHLKGACDEYAEGGQCNGGIDCDLCQSWYLTTNVDNENCELAICGTTETCMMKYNSTCCICPWTLQHWGWVDTNGDGLLDNVRRRVSNQDFVTIWELFHNGWFIWNNVNDSMAMSQRWRSWSVAGLRSPEGADYDIFVYEDNNHNYELANSRYGGNSVDFVVGDYNHRNPGIENILVDHYTGTTDNYNLTFESGDDVLYPDGVARAQNWGWYNVAKVWDVPLFAGETINIFLDETSGTLDVGMALFNSNGAQYHAGRSSAMWQADAVGVGGNESYTFAVPADDVYGLVVWSNTDVDGTFSIRIGPTLQVLAEESPFTSGLDLRLFSYTPNSFYWLFAGTRPQPGTNVNVRLFQDSAFQIPLEISDDYGAGGVEFFAVDYLAGYSTDYLRVIRTAGAGNHTTEWEQDPEIYQGVAAGSWVPGHVGRVWDTRLSAGQRYFFRQYNDSGGELLDAGIYVFDSVNGDLYRHRNDYTTASNFRPPADGGEWFSYTPTTTDWYAYIMIVNDESGGSYSNLMGPQPTMNQHAPLSFPDEVVWGIAPIATDYWQILSMRPTGSDGGSMALWGGSNYGIENWLGSETTGTGVRYMVADNNHAGVTDLYPRFRRMSGTGPLDVSYEGGNELLVFADGATSGVLDWPAGEVAQIWDLLVDGTGEPQPVEITVEHVSGQLDLGVALHSSSSGSFFQGSGAAVIRADDNGAGGDETITFTIDGEADWYGLVVFNQNDNGGQYEISFEDPTTVGVDSPTAGLTYDLRAVSANPFQGSAALTFSLTREGPAELAVFDVQGRRVRQLVQSTLAPGSHAVTWDGRDDAGRGAGPGIYIARLQTEEGQRSVKLIRSR